MDGHESAPPKAIDAKGGPLKASLRAPRGKADSSRKRIVPPLVDGSVRTAIRDPEDIVEDFDNAPKDRQDNVLDMFAKLHRDLETSASA